MTRAKYLVVGLALAVLLLAGIGVILAYGQMGSMMGGNGTGSMMGRQGMSEGQTDGNGMGGMMSGNGMGSMMGGGQMGSMMGNQGMAGGRMMGSFNEEKPFDLQFIDQMIMHHQGAIMSSEHMISDSERPELRQLAENIQESQSEQIEQMQEWREEWYGDDAGQDSGVMDPSQMDEMMGDGMMGGSMQGMMSGDMADVMFLRMMIPHHQLAIDMSEEALVKAEHPELKELAQTIIDEQSAEIEVMQGYLEEIEN
jgi:uncharacterized protein (DUF305 family)